MTAVTGDTTLLEVDGQTALLDAAPFRADITTTIAPRPSRCRCRPACLSVINLGERVAAVRGGWALLEHTERTT